MNCKACNTIDSIYEYDVKPFIKHNFLIYINGFFYCRFHARLRGKIYDRGIEWYKKYHSNIYKNVLNDIKSHIFYLNIFAQNNIWIINIVNTFLTKIKNPEECYYSYFYKNIYKFRYEISNRKDCFKLIDTEKSSYCIECSISVCKNCEIELHTCQNCNKFICNNCYENLFGEIYCPQCYCYIQL